MALAGHTWQLKGDVISNISIYKIDTPGPRDGVLSGIRKVENVRKSLLSEDGGSDTRVKNELQWQCIVQHHRYDNKVVVNLDGDMNLLFSTNKLKTQILVLALQAHERQHNKEQNQNRPDHKPKPRRSNIGQI